MEWRVASVDVRTMFGRFRQLRQLVCVVVVGRWLHANRLVHHKRVLVAHQRPQSIPKDGFLVRFRLVLLFRLLLVIDLDHTSAVARRSGKLHIAPSGEVNLLGRVNDGSRRNVAYARY